MKEAAKQLAIVLVGGIAAHLIASYLAKQVRPIRRAIEGF